MTAIADALVERITAAILEHDTAPRVFHRRYHRDLDPAQGPLTCAYCLAALPNISLGQPKLTYLVPPNLGGTRDPLNRVFSCPSCARSKGPKDLVAWRKFSKLGTLQSRAALLEQRRQALACSRNHLTPTATNASARKVRAALDSRWQHPRFTLYAVHGETRAFIGWTSRNGTGDAVGLAAVLLRHGRQAVQRAQGNVVLYELAPERFLETIWLLIDHHALVHALPDPLQAPGSWETDWRHAWPLHLETMLDLQRRRPRAMGAGATPVVPGPAPTLSTHPRTVASRRRYQGKAEQRRQQRYLEARAALDAFKEDVRQGRLPAPDLETLATLEREVLDLLPP